MLMHAQDKIYVFLCSFFSVLLICGNLVYQKFVTIIFFTPFEISCGAILYPLTYFTSDLIAEFYGRSKANFCIKNALILNILVAILIKFFESLRATNWSKVNDEIFTNVYGHFGIAFSASIIACFISQRIDIWLFLKISKLTNGKFILLRSNFSSATSLLIDTIIVVSLLVIFQILPQERLLKIIWDSYSFKLVVLVMMNPLFYLTFRLIKKKMLQS